MPVNFRAADAPELPFIECAAAGVSNDLVSRALVFAAAHCPPCASCSDRYARRVSYRGESFLVPGSCKCGQYARDNLRIIDRFIRREQVRSWLESQHAVFELRDFQRAAALANGPVLQRFATATDPRPEYEGFSYDGEVGTRQWLRFTERKPLIPKEEKEAK